MYLGAAFCIDFCDGCEDKTTASSAYKINKGLKAISSQAEFLFSSHHSKDDIGDSTT
jgi:hypothetical protein